MRLKEKTFLKAIKFFMLAVTAALLLNSCKTAVQKDYDNDEEMYLIAKKLFLDKDYKEAASVVDLLQLQYPASRYADDAQFLLAEINYAEKEFLVAAFNYNRVLKNFPASDYVKESMYKSAMCYFESSPTYDRDQNYTKQAIKAFQEFQYLFPNDSLSEEAGRRIGDLREKLANREYFTAELYRKLESPVSSVIYYDEVIKNFSDTKYFEPAFWGKIDALNLMGRKEQLKSLIAVYKETFPSGEHIEAIKAIEKEIK